MQPHHRATGRIQDLADTPISFNIVMMLAQRHELANQWIDVNPCGGRQIGVTATASGRKHAVGKCVLRR